MDRKYLITVQRVIDHFGQTSATADEAVKQAVDFVKVTAYCADDSIIEPTQQFEDRVRSKFYQSHKMALVLN